MLRFILRSIRHYRRINIVVMLAVAISTAVIGGSLIVGDSVRFSLRRMTEQRLGRITDVLHSPGFFRQALVAEMTGSENGQQPTADAPALAPAILVTGSVESSAGPTVDRTPSDKLNGAAPGSGQTNIRRAGAVTLLGIDDAGWQLLENGGLTAPLDRQVVLGYRTAQELRASVGDEVSVWVEVPSSIPRDSLLGERDDVNVEMVLTVSAVIPEDVGASRFDLNPGQQLPYNAFVPLATLQERLGLEEIEASRRSPVAKSAKVNTILADLTPPSDVPPDGRAAELDDLLQRHLKLPDLGLRLRTIADRGYISAESDRMILQDPLSDAVMAAAESLGLATAPTIVYLSNELYADSRQTTDQHYSMYSIIAGLRFDSPAPLGPFRLDGNNPVPTLGPRDILLSAWLAADLQAAVGDSVQATWHEVGSHGELPEIQHALTVRGILPDDDEVSTDRDLTPFVEGVTDIDDFGDVDQPFEMDMDRLTTRDDDYWEAHRATPKAFVSLEAAEEFWNSRYGRHTSIRIAPSGGTAKASAERLSSIAERMSFQIPQRLKPLDLGLAFRPVRAEGLNAAVGANDFTQLFLGFSFFLILSAIILASLMFRLGIQRRISQLGVLNAVGWPAGRIQRAFLAEGLLVSVAGSLLGTIGGVLFAQVMIYGLKTWWVGAVGTQFLLLHVQPLRLAMAAAVSVCLAAVVIWLALRSFRQISIRDQLAGNADLSETGVAESRGLWAKLVRLVGVGALLTAVGLPAAVMGNLIPSGEAFAGLTWQMVCFFLAGFSCLTAGLYLLSAALRRRSRSHTVGGAVSGLSGLALANAARSPMRSMLTTALIAFATFVIVAVAAGRRNPLSEIPDITSGNGGFSLVAEAGKPVLFDVNTADGRRRLGLTGTRSLGDDLQVFSFSMKPGADASCVNLYQTRLPTLLGAADEFLERGGFRFAYPSGDKRWQLLRKEIPDEGALPVIPVIGDMNTLMYSLKKGMGGRILVPDDKHPKFALEVVGMLDGSVFQGVLIMTDANLKRVDPDVAGARYFLVDTPGLSEMSATSSILESTLNDYGLDAEPVSERLAGFLAVQNTYLSTFQMLGGLGLLVGTFGLAAVMMRNVVERRREIALMRAVGFTRLRVARLILSENWVLLIWGIVLGTGSALLAMLPHLLSTGADLPRQQLLITLAVIALTGSLASVFAVRATTMSIRDSLASE